MRAKFNGGFTGFSFSLDVMSQRSHAFNMRGFIALILAFSFQARANVVGADTQNFNPTNDGLDFVTVHSSETLTPGILNLGFFMNYAVNSLPNYEDVSTQTRTNFSDSLLSADFNFAIGLAKDWEAGFSFPYLLSQSVSSDATAYRGEFANPGLTEIRVMSKYRLFGDNEAGIAAIVSANFNQIEDNPFLGDGAGPTFNFEVAADRTFGLFAAGVNAGYRLRDPGTPVLGVPIEPIGNQIIGSAAVSYLVTGIDTKIIAELFGSFPTESGIYVSDRDDSSLEFLLGAKHDLSRSVALHVGGGTEVVHGTSSPDWRVYTGINWVIGPLFSQPREVMVRVEDKELKSLEDMDPEDPYVGKPQVAEAFIARDVLFDLDSDRLQPGGRAVLQKLADYLKKPPGFETVTVEGHTDSMGPALYNLDLSQRRANTVRTTLIAMGIPAAKVRSIGFGESRPIADNGNYQGRAMNRRVEFKVRRASKTEVIR
jgi:outer membrane protein OmpA-like peptidoglycan-associated protein